MAIDLGLKSRWNYKTRYLHLHRCIGPTIPTHPLCRRLLRICVDLGRMLQQVHKHVDISASLVKRDWSSHHSLATRCYLRHIILTGTDFARQALQRCCLLTYGIVGPEDSIKLISNVRCRTQLSCHFSPRPRLAQVSMSNEICKRWQYVLLSFTMKHVAPCHRGSRQR